MVESYTRGFDEKWGPYVHLRMTINDPVNLSQPWELFWDILKQCNNCIRTGKPSIF